jgi:ubiquinone/menaquinone biosynthesis C-methylase UbiE
MAHLNTAPRFDRAPRFDGIARIYRAMEFLSFGPMLERCRFFHLPQLNQARRALVFGDGDGRFLARLLSVNREVHADAVDASPAMLRLLDARVAQTQAQSRVSTTCADIREFQPRTTGYDLVTTHFFLDCLTPAETAALIARSRPHLAPNAQWLVSEFALPRNSRLRAGLSRVIISALYTAFRLLTGLTVRAIPPWRDLLAQAGFACVSSHASLGGLLVSELWQVRQTTATAPQHSHREVTLSCEFAQQAGCQASSLPDLTFGSIPGIDPGPLPAPDPPAVPEPSPAPGPAPEPDPIPYPGPIPTPQPVTRSADPIMDGLDPVLTMGAANPHHRRCRPIMRRRMRRQSLSR